MDNEFPEVLVHILTESGFDSKASLKSIKPEHVSLIEDHFNSNYEKFSNGLLGTKYEHIRPFKLLPGHCVLIENIPKYLEEDITFESSLVSASVNHSSVYSCILKSLIETAEKNSGRNPTGNRYDQILRYFATYVYLMSGKASYETLSANLPIPHANTIRKINRFCGETLEFQSIFYFLVNYISQNKKTIIEGRLRCSELSDYLDQMELEKFVWLCEDGTGINEKIEFDSRTGQLIGLLLPTESNNGMPKAFSFLARTEEDIKKYVKMPKSTLVQVVLAQPIMPHMPPYILQIFGTDNRFKTEHVMKRWKHIVEELKKCVSFIAKKSGMFIKNIIVYVHRHGIKVAGISSDGDWRFLNTMLQHTDLNAISSDTTSLTESICYLQDIVHIITKLRNRLLKASIVLPFGCKLVSVAHLKILINEVPKADHGLVYSDICPDDRQNFKSFEKVMEKRVTDALKTYVIGSEGTIMYIDICRKIRSSLYEDNLPPIVRISLLWEATFLLRIWQKWINSSDVHNLDDNFITQNAYECVELNATNLVLLVKSFRDQNLDRLFIPTLFNSQPNEETFRQLRSMGTMNYTKINFTLLELFHLVGRVELQNDIVYVKLANANISFPRNKVNKVNLNQYKLPSDKEIQDAISDAKRNAIKNVPQFGIYMQQEDIEKCELKQRDALKYTKKIVDNCPEDEPTISPQNGDTERSRFIEIVLDSGIKKTVRKSTLLWTLTDSTKKLSNDRLKRVRDASKEATSMKKQPKRRRLEFMKTDSAGKTSPVLSLLKKDELQIGEWCVFKFRKTESNKSSDVFVLGNILSFKYIKGRTEKENQYSWDFAPVFPA